MPAAEADRPGKVFVGGLASDIDEAVLEKYFSHFGRLTEVIVKRDKNTQQTRGYAFITFENPYDAEDAIKEMDKKDIHGRQIYVEQAVKPRHETQNLRMPPRGGGSRGMSRGGRGGGSGRGGGGSRGGPRGGRGDGHMDMRSRSPIRQRPDRGRSDREFRRDSFDGPQRRDLIDEFEHKQTLDEDKPWITPDLVLLLRQKDEMQEWASKCPSLVTEFRKFRNHVRMKIRKAKVEYEDPTGEKRDAEFMERMLKKGLTPEEIEKKKVQGLPETHHGGKKYEPPIMYPGNLATGSSSMKVGTNTETMSVTRDPEAVQQKAKFVNLLSKQSKTVYDSYRQKDVSNTNWSESEGFHDAGNQGWNNQGFASSSREASANFVKPLNYPQTQQGYSQPNTANWQKLTEKTSQQNWQKNSNQQQQWGPGRGKQEWGPGREKQEWGPERGKQEWGPGREKQEWGPERGKQEWGPERGKQEWGPERGKQEWGPGREKQEWGPGRGKQEYTWSSKYDFKSDGHSASKNQYGGTKSEESKQNPWQEAMAEYWQKAGQESSFGKSKETSSVLQSTVGQNRSFVSQTQSSSNQTPSFSNQQFSSHTQQSANQSLPFNYQTSVRQNQPPASQTSFSNQRFASHTQQSANQSLPFNYQTSVRQNQPPASQTSFSNQQFASHTQQSANQSLPFNYQPSASQIQPPASQTSFSNQPSASQIQPPASQTSFSNQPSASQIQPPASQTSFSNQQFASRAPQSANQSLPFAYQPSIGQTQSSSSQALSFSNQQFATQTQQSANQSVPYTYQSFANQTRPTTGQTPFLNQQFATQTQSSADQSQNTATSTENKSADSNLMGDHLSYGPDSGANKDIKKAVNDNTKGLKDSNNPSKQSSQSSKLGKRQQVPNIQQIKDKPAVQYFKGVAKNQNKIQIRINPKSAFGVEVEKESDVNEKESNVEEMEISVTEKESDVSKKSEPQVEEKDVSSALNKLSDNANPWQQEIQKYWENPPKDSNSQASQQECPRQSSETDAQAGQNKIKDESNAQSKPNEPKQINEMSKKNDQENQTKSEVIIEDIPLPCESDLKPVNQSLIEFQKQALEKVISSKPLKDKNWSENMEICDQDIEELNLSTDSSSHYFPHPANVPPPRDFTESNSDGFSFSTSYNDPFGQGEFEDFGGDRYGGMDRGMDRGPPQRSRDPPMSRGRDHYSPGPRDFGRSSGPDRMSRGSGRDFQQSSRYESSLRDFTPPPREFQSSRDIGYERALTSRDRVSARDYGSPTSSRDFGGMSRSGSSMYGGSREAGMGGRDVYSGGRDRDQPQSRDFSSREFSSRGGSMRGVQSRGGSDYDRGQSHEDSFRDSGRSGPSSRGPASRVFSSMGSQRDSGRPSHGMYESSNRGPSRGGMSSNRGPPARGGPPQRDDRDRVGYSTGQRRPSNMDSRGGPPMKRSRPSGPPSRGSMRR